jgi:hypothetical protein
MPRNQGREGLCVMVSEELLEQLAIRQTSAVSQKRGSAEMPQNSVRQVLLLRAFAPSSY